MMFLTGNPGAVLTYQTAAGQNLKKHFLSTQMMNTMTVTERAPLWSSLAP